MRLLFEFDSLIPVFNRMRALKREGTYTMNGKIICKLQGELSELLGL